MYKGVRTAWPLTPWKVWYAGSQFRYEKPQRGRYRQFDQVGIEVLGADDPYLDVEVIALGWEFYRALGLIQVKLLLNSLGEPEDRARYVAALREYFEANRGSLSPESPDHTRQEHAPRARLETSWRRSDHRRRTAHRRVLQRMRRGTSKVCRPGSRRWASSSRSTTRFVRGLDYYRHTTFEYQGGTLDSAQNALGGGGRYDGLVESLGGPPTHGIGFASGSTARCWPATTRACSPRAHAVLDVFLVDTTGGLEALQLTAELRAAGLSADRAYENRSMKAQMKVADRSGAAVAVIIGSNEACGGRRHRAPSANNDGQQTDRPFRL